MRNSAQSCSVACAWILWTLLGDGSYFPSSGYNDKQSCEMALEKVSGKAQDERVKKLQLCLPDTVDPRGPK
jgi:hypothetical protein